MEWLSAGLRAATGRGESEQTGPTPFTLEGGLIAAEWGEASLKLYLLRPDGAVEDSREASGVGAAELIPKPPQKDPAKFEDVFEQQCRSLEEGRPGPSPRPALVCGLAGSRAGWCAVVSTTLPAGVKQLATGAVRVPTRSGRAVFVVPGLASRPQRSVLARLDALRGEETRVMGSLIHSVMHPKPGQPFRPRRLFCLLGPAASQWILAEDGSIVFFRSYRKTHDHCWHLGCILPRMSAMIVRTGTATCYAALAPAAGAATTLASLGGRAASGGNAAAAVEQGLTEGFAGEESLLHQLNYLREPARIRTPTHAGEIPHDRRHLLLAHIARSCRSCLLSVHCMFVLSDVSRFTACPCCPQTRRRSLASWVLRTARRTWPGCWWAPRSRRSLMSRPSGPQPQPEPEPEPEPAELRQVTLLLTTLLLPRVVLTKVVKAAQPRRRRTVLARPGRPSSPPPPSHLHPHPPSSRGPGCTSRSAARTACCCSSTAAHWSGTPRTRPPLASFEQLHPRS